MSQYPIRIISELTGVASTTLRAWERRYSLLKPDRTTKGHRLYSSQDIELIKEIVRLLKNNHTISEAILITRNPGLNAAVEADSDAHWSNYQQRILKAIESFNEQKLDKVYNEVLLIYPPDMVNGQVITPVLNTLGTNSQRREAGIAEEHFFSAFLRNKLGARLHHETQRSRGRKILVSCLPGEYHELGILLFSIAAMGHGYQILYLGTDLPLSQLPMVVQRTDVAAVLISASSIEQFDSQLEKEIVTMIKTLPVPVMFGGQLSASSAEIVSKQGAHNLGADHGPALDKMESIVPAFYRK